MQRCKDCLSWGHRAGPRCPYHATIQRQDPFGLNAPRPKQEVEYLPFDPALREATLRTIFLPRANS